MRDTAAIASPGHPMPLTGRPVARPSESGVALIVLLLVALFAALVGVAMMDATVREVQIAVNESTSVKARYLA